VSVVVPVRNGAPTLSGQLQALERQDYDGGFEVVLADNGSTDATRAIARAWTAGRPHRRLVHARGKRGPGYARNVGAAAADGELLAFCDADDVVAEGWLSALVRAASRAELVAGRNDVERLNDPLRRSWNVAPPPDRAVELHGFLPLAGGSNLGIWADVLRDLGGFDERPRCGEDVAVCWRAQLAGRRLAFAPDAVVHQRYRRRLSSFARQYFAYGRGDAWLYRCFRSAGMPATPPAEVRTRWRALLIGAPQAIRCPTERGRWVQRAALTAGRLAGSLRYRSLFL
jgi:glycosyltransferase involved in cell wall biosynthesis